MRSISKIMSRLRRWGLALFAGCMMMPLVAAGQQSYPGTDADAMEAVISRQLTAFARGDSGTAYAQASPLIQAMFPNHEIFMAMVRDGYSALIRPSKVDFLGVKQTADGPVVGVKVFARDGSLWLAAYQMVREEGEQWRINGCRLTRYAGEPT